MTARFFFAAIVVSVTGCATRPISNADALPVPAERIIDSRYSQAATDTGQITVKRDSGLGGSACSSRIFVNAKPVADLRTSEKIVLFLPAGDHVLSAWPNGACGGGMTEVRASVRTGSELTFRVGYGSNGDFTINPTAF